MATEIGLPHCIRDPTAGIACHAFLLYDQGAPFRWEVDSRPAGGGT
jgi:hypothetical protein